MMHIIILPHTSSKIPCFRISMTLTLFTLVAHVTLQRIQLYLHLLVLPLGVRALTLVDDDHDDDDGDEEAPTQGHADDPQFVTLLVLRPLVLQLPQGVDEAADPHLNGSTHMT